jgi:membrane protein CcdC involved in cytochrome C biogenesis
MGTAQVVHNSPYLACLVLQILIALLVGIALGVVMLNTSSYTAKDHHKRIVAIFFLIATTFMNQ